MGTEGCDDGMGRGALREVENNAKVSRLKKGSKIISRRVCVSCWKWLEGECYGGSQPCIYESVYRYT
jgi:hypothetical protein